MDARSSDSQAQHHAFAYSPVARAAGAALLACGYLGRAAIAALVLTAADPPVTLPLLLRLTLILAALPAALAWLVDRATRVTLHGIDGALRARGARIDVEVPASAVAAIDAWRLPLPHPGFSARLRSGQRLPVSFGGDDTSAILCALRDAGIDGAAAALRHPTAIYAAARRPFRRGWRHRLAKFPLFALLPTAILFNTHQHIAYGGTFGQYYLISPTAYFSTFAAYWATVTIYLVLYASIWRGVAEVGNLALAWTAPAVATAARRGAEIACAALYYGGIPLLLALRYAA